jgi:hypothetical protein
MAQIVDGSGSGLVMTVVATPANSAAIIRYDSSGREVSLQSKNTYSVSVTFTPVPTPTDLVIITGSTTATIRVISLYVGTSNTLGGVSSTLFVIKRGNMNLGGTFVPATAVPHDSASAAATAVVGHYTANPTTLGQTLGTVNVVRVSVPAVTPTSYAGIAEEDGIELLPWYAASVADDLVTLRGPNESLVVNHNAAALLPGQVHVYRITWMEE